MAKRPRRLAKNKTSLMLKNASCKRWDTLKVSPHTQPGPREGKSSDRYAALSKNFEHPPSI